MEKAKVLLKVYGTVFANVFCIGAGAACVTFSLSDLWKIANGTYTWNLK